MPIPYDVKLVARLYTVQYKHVKRHAVGCAFMFVKKFMDYVSATNRQNWMTFELPSYNKYQTGDGFFLTPCTVT